MAGIKQGRHTRTCTNTKQAAEHYGRSRLCWRNRSSKAQVVRHPCLARSTTSAPIILSTTRTDQRNGSLKLLWRAPKLISSVSCPFNPGFEGRERRTLRSGAPLNAWFGSNRLRDLRGDLLRDLSRHVCLRNRVYRQLRGADSLGRIREWFAMGSLCRQSLFYLRPLRCSTA